MEILQASACYQAELNGSRSDSQCGSLYPDHSEDGW